MVEAYLEPSGFWYAAASMTYNWWYQGKIESITVWEIRLNEGPGDG